MNPAVPDEEVRICPVCDTPFTVDRQHRRQLYCSRTHQVKAYRAVERRRLAAEGRHVPPARLTHPLMLRLSEDTFAELQALARARQVSIAELIRLIVADHR